jgi:uncharacterized RmlC-like cupin family protein
MGNIFLHTEIKNHFLNPKKMSENTQPYHRRKFPGNFTEINNRIQQEFLMYSKEENIKRTHYFNGRYENIYLNEQHIPQLKSLMQQANKFARAILGTDNTNKIKQGYWFNAMPPESTTTLHTHDDDDELLSCVYYVHVPKNSGDLIIHHNKTQFKIQPKAGEFIFFKPDIPHEVSKNISSEHRLSIGINFGRT